VGRGHVVRRDGSFAFVEAALSDADNRLVAIATATLRVVELERRQAA
jgi:acyl-coenzyme A thioesterase PaaI-like protein